MEDYIFQIIILLILLEIVKTIKKITALGKRRVLVKQYRPGSNVCRDFSCIH